MKAKILPNIFISVAVSFAFTRLLAAGMSDGVLNFSATPLVHRHPTFITFDVPGAISTGPIGINPAGTITGSYANASLIDHGFVRAPNGTITTFDPPGSTNTFPTAINQRGNITGWYIDASNVSHGFERAPKGTITTFDPPGSVFTSPTAINPAGIITGGFSDASGVGHGFVGIP